MEGEPKMVQVWRRERAATERIGRLDRRGLLCGAAALAVGGGSFAGAGASAMPQARSLSSVDGQAADCLTWAPPPLTNPVTIQLGSGATSNVLDDDTDYIVKLPTNAVKNGWTRLIGGRNVVMIGGHIRIPSNDGTDGRFKAIFIKNNTGTVHIEGVLITTAEDGQGTAVQLASPDSIVQVQNTRILNLKGGFDQLHADVISTNVGVQQLRVDKLTGTSSYAGLQVPKNLGTGGTTVTVKRTNLTAQPEWYPGAGGGYMVWLSDQVTYSLSDLYVQPRPNRALGRSVWPDINHAENPVVVDEGGFAHWPTLPNVTGGVQSGSPPGGSFVPPGVAGLNYTSPGYC